MEDVQDPQPGVADQPSAPVTARPPKLTVVATLDLVKTEGDKEFPWFTGLDFMSDGRIAAVDFDNKKCYILNAELQRQGSAFKYNCHPFDVSCYKESKLAVVLGYVQTIRVLLVTIIYEKICLVDPFGYY